MKNQKINYLLIALSSALCLSACNSGTSSSSTPTPTPTPVPTPTPIPPGPTPTPTPVAGESGVYAIAPFSLSMSFATQPSAANWVNYTSGTTNSIAGLVATESKMLVLDRPAVAGGDTSAQYNIYGGTQAQLLAANTSLPVTITDGGAIAGGMLPKLNSTQIATNGANVVVAAPSTMDFVYTVTGFTLYVIAANGAPTAITSYYNSSGTSTALAPASEQPVVVFINGMYYAYNVVAGSVLYSQNGATWQQALITGAVGSSIANVVQVSGTVFALQASALHPDIYLGSGPFTFATTAATSVNTTENMMVSNGDGRLYIYSEISNLSKLACYTPTSSSLGAMVANSSNFTQGNPLNALLFANNNLYAVFANDGNTLLTYPLQVNGNTITAGANPLTASVSAPNSSIYTLDVNGGFVSSNGKQLLVVNGNTTYAEYGSTDSNNGTIAAVSLLDFNTGLASITNLPTGMNYTSAADPLTNRQTLIAGFAGTQSGYMLALTNGDVLVSSESGFVQASPILHPLDGTSGEGMPADVEQLVSTNGTYLAADRGDTSSGGGNLYFSANNGASWTDIPAASLPVYPSNGPIITTENGYYFIIFSGENKIYQTATPQNLATWVQVSTLPLVTNSVVNKKTQTKALANYQLNNIYINNPYKYYDGAYYEFYGTTSLGVFNQLNGETLITDNILPADTYYENIAYNGSVFAIMQEASNYVWTSSSLTGGVSKWKQNIATYNGIDGALDVTNMIGSFLWTGKIWVLGNSIPTGSFGTPAPQNVFSSTNLTTWNAAAYTQPTGGQTNVIGLPRLF